jgi:hypothetical protein
MEFSGRLAAFPISDILQWAQNDRRTGSLVVRRSGTEKRVYFRDGDIVACFSDDAAEFFGQHLLVRGFVDEAKLIQTLTFCKRNGHRLGDALVELGILGAESVAAALREHVEDQVCELFLWKSGIFFFTNEMVPPDQELPVPLPAAAVALEGSRRADEHGRFRRIFVHDKIRLERGAKRAEAPTPLEKRVLRAVEEGERTLAEIYTDVRGSWYRFLDAAYRLTVQGALDIAEVGEATDTHSTELRLADLLMEQVADEQTVFLRQHLAVPFEALARCVPVWVRPPDADEDSRMSDPVREFYAQIDGRADLATLLEGVGREERSRRMDRLILQLRKGSLALLPAPLDELAQGGDEGGRGRLWRKLRSALSGS